jgi:hypothetical protein
LTWAPAAAMAWVTPAGVYVTVLLLPRLGGEPTKRLSGVSGGLGWRLAGVARHAVVERAERPGACGNRLK